MIKALMNFYVSDLFPIVVKYLIIFLIIAFIFVCILSRILSKRKIFIDNIEFLDILPGEN